MQTYTHGFHPAINCDFNPMYVNAVFQQKITFCGNPNMVRLKNVKMASKPNVKFINIRQMFQEEVVVFFSRCCSKLATDFGAKYGVCFGGDTLDYHVGYRFQQDTVLAAVSSSRISPSKALSVVASIDSAPHFIYHIDSLDCPGLPLGSGNT